MTSRERGTRDAGHGAKRPLRSFFNLRPAVLILAASAAAGCQQKMAEQPYYRPYEPADFTFRNSLGEPDVRSNRPLEPGTVHRGQYLDSDPLVTGLTREEWVRFWHRDDNQGKVDVD